MKKRNFDKCGFLKLSNQVIKAGLCCFCGTCISACPKDNIFINYDKEIPYRMDYTLCPPHCIMCWNVCPGKTLNYPQLETNTFGRERKTSEWALGIYRFLNGGFASLSNIRKAGTSGGVGTTLLLQALQSKMVEGVIKASYSEIKPWYGAPIYTNDFREIENNPRSKYVPIPMNALIKEAAQKYKTLAITALPCHAAGIRKAQTNNIKVFQQIKYIIGLACGYCTYNYFYEHLINETLGTPLEDVRKVEFRGGPYPGEFRVYKNNGSFVSCPTHVRIIMALSYIRDRCSMCIDWGAELADISLADLFTRKETDKSGNLMGNTAIIVRTKIGEELVKSAEKAKTINLFDIEENELSGNIGLEWKKHGFANHLQNRKNNGWPVPCFGVSGNTQLWSRPIQIYNRKNI